MDIKKNSDIIAAYEVEGEAGLLEFLEKKQNVGHKKLTAMLTHGQVSVNGVVRTKYDTRLFKGNIVRIKRFGMKNIEEKSLLDIIYEDEAIVVVNKPTGLLTVSNDSEKDRTLYRLMTEYIRKSNPTGRIFIVHRLDRDTSGVVVFAKTEEIKRELQDNWDEICRVRGYLAIVEGVPKDKEKRLVDYLKETSIHTVYIGSEGDGKKAITNFKLIKTNGKFSLLEVRLETGRKNQIRVQLKNYGCPIIGDKRYGSALNPINRLGLHAGVLEIIHPTTGKPMRFTAKANKKFVDFVAVGRA